MSEKQQPGNRVLTVAEAGRLGGEKTRDTHGHDFYEKIGRMGGQRVRRLIEAGKAAEGQREEEQ